MPPDSRENTPTRRRQFCGLGNHHLKTPNRALTDRNLLDFARKINPEVREGTLICLECFQMLKKIFGIKVGNARRLKKQADSISDASSSQQQSALLSSLVPSAVTSTVTLRRNPSPPSPASTSSNYDRPLSADKEVRQETKPQGAAPPSTSPDSSHPVSDDDDPNSNLSLNAVNGTRLPHIQPIPRRRQTVHLNKQAMDIYLAGTTGG